MREVHCLPERRPRCVVYMYLSLRGCNGRDETGVAVLAFTCHWGNCPWGKLGSRWWASIFTRRIPLLSLAMGMNCSLDKYLQVFGHDTNCMSAGRSAMNKTCRHIQCSKTGQLSRETDFYIAISRKTPYPMQGVYSGVQIDANASSRPNAKTLTSCTLSYSWPGSKQPLLF